MVMRIKAILALLFLFSVGLVTMLVIRALPEKTVAAATGAAVPKDEVLAAATALQGGTLLRAQDLAWTTRAGEPQAGEIVRPPEWTRNTKPETDEATRAEVYGAALRADLAAG